MEKLEIIELIVQLDFNEESFHKLIDPAGRLQEDKRQHYRREFEKMDRNLLSFYKSLEGEEAEWQYIKDSINSFVDQKIRARLQALRPRPDDTSSTDKKKIKPIDDLEGSDSWGYNDDVKWK